MEIEIFVKDRCFGDFIPRTYNTEEDDIRSILVDVCRFIEHQVDFKVSGFGQDHWPVDTGTDLPVFLEQLPATIKALEIRQSANIDFYEQGIERYLKLDYSNINDFYEISCTSNTDWKPDPKIEKIHASELIDIFSNIKRTFITIMTELSPTIIHHPWVTEWKNI
ncbi:hypothetical protein [Pseudomonas abieticivorans]|uniref:hypothetical protein n=1 Tax=Pseudomonas abieticivorans TaxID=2931382 RepID=UPI0020C0EB0F|nr:hypothetical protein [Pseudomonas sp. PIA16]